MSTPFEIPLLPTPQVFRITLAGVPYRIRSRWNHIEQYWVIDLMDADGVSIIDSIPLVTGADLFGQFDYLNLGGRLEVQSNGDKNAVPTFENLGSTGHLYFIVP